MLEAIRRLDQLEPHRRAELFALLEERGEEFGVYPAAPAQRRLWLLHHMYPDSPAYNVPCAFRITGPCDEGAMERSLGILVRRHEALRTVFLEVAGEPRQVITEDARPEFAVLDLPGLDAPARDRAAREQAERLAVTPFDLAVGPLLRARLIRFAPDDAMFVLCLHHVACDGVSVQILLGELSELYRADLDERLDPLPPVELQYLDYATWQQEWLRTEPARRMGEAWTAELAGIPAVLELPHDRPRPRLPTLHGDAFHFSWRDGAAERVGKLARAETATPFMVLAAAYVLLLARHSGQDEVVLGTTTANRGLERAQRVVGLLANTAVLRVRVDRRAGFRALLRGTRAAILTAQENDQYPFDAVVDALKMPRSTAHHPVFQAMITCRDAVTEALTLAGAEVRALPMHNKSAKFDLSLDLVCSPAEISGSLEYDTALFDPEIAQLLVERCLVLLEAAIDDPDLPVAQLPILAERERALLFGAWNPPPGPGPATLMHEAAERQAERAPDAVAVHGADGILTYRQLDDQANRLAHLLRRRGVARGSFVGIAVERSSRQFVAMQAVLKTGAAYVPLDPAYPADRIAFMVQDAKLACVLTESGLEDRLPGAAPRLALDRLAPELARESADRVASDAGPDDLAYVIYTSGSTGRPKGAMIRHRSVANFATEQAAHFGVGPDDRVLQFASFSFDISVLETMLAFHCGARLVVADRESLRPGPELARTLAERAVTVAFLPQAVLRLADAEHLRGVRTVIVGGEVCPEESAARWAPDRTFITIYGPTETTVWMTHAVLRGDERPVPIGRPLPNVPCYVLDEAGEPCPLGVPGELYIGGASTARGYLARPDLTADRFVPDPYSGVPGARLYRSGDIVRWARDGQLRFDRRIDDQVKIRGYRVELGEIQARLDAHPSVRASVVIDREDEPGDVRLAAYVVPEPGYAVDAALLRAELRSALPEFMIPAAFVELESIPRTPNGKLDRASLPRPRVRGTAAGHRAAPAAGIESVITGIWREILHVEQVGPEDNFFDLGGNSLLIAKARARLEQALDRRVDTLTVFRCPTVLSLARHLEGEGTPEPAPAAAAPTDRTALLARGARRRTAGGAR
jgi:amino acid adenylation domain-containing protein